MKSLLADCLLRDTWMAMIQDLARWGDCKQLVENDPMMKTWQNYYDSAWAPFSAVNPGDKGKEENCVKDPKKITVVQAIAGSTGELRAGGYDIIDGKLRKVRGAR